MRNTPVGVGGADGGPTWYPDTMSESVKYRVEHDTMGEVRVPARRCGGPRRSGRSRTSRSRAGAWSARRSARSGWSRRAAARVNARIGVLDPRTSPTAIAAAADEVAAGAHDDQFPIDVFQTGSGTSSNMNANEVIATLATRASGIEVHPNDHVNASQTQQRRVPDHDPRRRHRVARH